MPGRHRVGFRPDRRVTFFCCPRRKSPKKRGRTPADLIGSLRLHTYLKGSGTRTSAELPHRFPHSHSVNSVSIRLDPAGHRREDPSGSSRSENKRTGISEEAEAVVRCRFSCQSLCSQPSGRSVTPRSAGVQALCFGDFHLGPQMKVTRVPGRNPAQSTA